MESWKRLFAELLNTSPAKKLAMPLLSVLKLRLLVFLTVFASIAFVNTHAFELEGGWQSISITEDMVGKSFSQTQVKGDCDAQQAWGVYDTKRQPSKTEGQWVRLHWQDDSRTITDEMVGYGLFIYTPEGKKCSLKTKGYAENLRKASRLASGWNFISASKGMVGKSFAELPLAGTCAVEKVRLYSLKGCEMARRDPEDQGTCVGDYAIIDPAAKITNFYLGKGVWVKAASDCTLDDSTPAEVLCNEAECAAKSGCDGTNYRTYGCQNKECSEVLSKIRGCTVEEKAKAEGVNLVPELVVNPQEGVKGGDTIEVALNVKNTGTKSTRAKDVLGQCAGPSDNNCRMSFFSVVHFYKDKEYGPEVAPSASADVSLLFPEKEIKPKGEGKLEVIKRSVKIPDDFSGNLVIVAVVDSQQKYVEAEGGEDDNRQTKTIAVRPAKLPDLVATEAEPVPALEKVPVTLESVKIKVKNTGELDAVAENQFLENTVTIKKGNEVICSGSIRNLLTIKPGQFAEGLPSVSVKAPGNNPCPIDDKDANYWAVIDVDSLSAVKESDEKNQFPFQFKGPQTCSPLGSREAGKYCSIATGTWLTQRADGQQCSHNFECKTELCIKNKCVTEAQKEQILKIVS